MYISANIADRIKALAKLKNISIKQLLDDVGLGFNTMSNMKTSVPKADNLARIADYLDCSVDYLLGRTDVSVVNGSLSESKGLSEHERRLVAAYRNNPHMQDAVDTLLGVQTTHTIYRAARSINNTEHRLEERSEAEMEKLKRATPVTSDDDL